MKPQYFEQIPIPELKEKKAKKPFIDMVDKILSAKQKEKDTKALEDELDNLVFKLYDLSKDEIAIINSNQG